jgi:hypothetical protein
VRVSIEVLEVESRLQDSAILVGIGLLLDPVSILLKRHTGLFLDEIANAVEFVGKLALIDEIQVREIEIVGKTCVREVRLAETVPTLEHRASRSYQRRRRAAPRVESFGTRILWGRTTFGALIQRVAAPGGAQAARLFTGIIV